MGSGRDFGTCRTSTEEETRDRVPDVSLPNRGLHRAPCPHPRAAPLFPPSLQSFAHHSRTPGEAVGPSSEQPLVFPGSPSRALAKVGPVGEWAGHWSKASPPRSCGLLAFP